MKDTRVYSERILKLIKSPLFILATLCTLAVLVFEIIALCTPIEWKNVLDPIFAMYGYKLGGDVELLMTIATIFGGLVAGLPIILITVGLITLIISAFAKKGAGGMGLIRAGVVIELIYVSIATLAAFGGSAAMLIYIDEYDAAFTFGSLALLSGAVISAALLVIMIVYLALILSCIRHARRAIEENVYSKKPSKFVAIINFVVGVLVAFGALSQLLFYLVPLEDIITIPRYISGVTDVFNSMLLWTMIASALSAITLILFGAVILRARAIDAPSAEEIVPHPPVPVVAPVEEPAAEPVEEPVAEEPAKPTRYCGKCGRALYADEICGCESANS